MARKNKGKPPAKSKEKARKPKGAAAFSGAKERAARAAEGGKANGKGARSRTLPGMERVRNRKLDNLCEAIGEERRRMNAAKLDEQASIQASLQVMQRENISIYKHAGVELARVPGAEKLRVRLTKEDGDADETDLETGETENDQLGDERRKDMADLGVGAVDIGGDAGEVH